ncbi:MAG: hypothetical protein SLAVMIC_00254 [uncultured marine phage]|uniref:Uncharacterized protein n=1 Tax=uncultured marine phage TaxID=707152 RepID=A0A8D9FRE0_9VIRU|nr:MAG: hypothetical protein SLAVMIC_00254 [uncultured marine phage]
MYKLYKLKVKKGVDDNLIIFAKPRVGYRKDGKFLEGICLAHIRGRKGTSPKGTSIGDNYPLGYHTKCWGTQQFELLSEEESLTLKSDKNIFEINGDICIRVKGNKNPRGRGKSERGIWQIYKDGEIEFYPYRSTDPDDPRYGICEKRFSDRWTPIKEFKIKNKKPLDA